MRLAASAACKSNKRVHAASAIRTAAAVLSMLACNLNGGQNQRDRSRKGRFPLRRVSPTHTRVGDEMVWVT